MDLYKWQMLREMMWVTYIAPNQDPKKMAKRKEIFLPLNGDKKINSGVSEAHKEIFLKEFQKWHEATSKIN